METLGERESPGLLQDRPGQDVSGIVTRLILSYVERRGGRDAVDKLLERTSEDEKFLRDPNNWVSRHTFLLLLEGVSNLFSDEDVPAAISRSFSQFEPGIVEWLMVVEGNPMRAYIRLNELTRRMFKGNKISVVKKGRTHVEVTYRQAGMGKANPLELAFLRGFLEGIPTLFGWSPAQVSLRTLATGEGILNVTWKDVRSGFFIAPILAGIFFAIVFCGLSTLNRPARTGSMVLAGALGFATAFTVAFFIPLHLRSRKRGRWIRQQGHRLLLTESDMVRQKISELKDAHDDLEVAYMSTIRALVKALEAKDQFTRGHSLRVARYAIELAKALNLSPDDVRDLSCACFVHDIGKIGVDDGVLRKKEILDHVELKHARAHAVIGQDIISTVGAMQKIGMIVRYHHERWDGSGYPDGIAGEDIPVLSRVLAIADVFDVLIAGRPYKEPLTIENAKKEMQSQSGKQFDPGLIRRFLEVLQNEQVVIYPTMPAWSMGVVWSHAGGVDRDGMGLASAGRE